MDIKKLAEDFITYYYQTFDSDRTKLSTLYRANSMLTFEGQEYLSANSIAEKLISLPFQTIRHKIITFDVQPSIAPGTILISVIGQLLVDQEANPMGFSQTFLLGKEGESYFVFNDMFRLNIG